MTYFNSLIKCYQHPLLIIISCLFSFFSNTGFCQPLVPMDIPYKKALTSSQETKMGEEFMGQLYGMDLVLEDPIATEFLQNLGNELVKATPYAKQSFHFFILKDNNINAFAGPGGHIGVNVGLILATDNQDELASVLAHELAHVTQGHLASQLAEMSKVKTMSLASMAGIVALGAINPAAATAALATTMAGTEQHFLNFSRGQEKEADRVGMKTLNQSGFDPTCMVNFFKKLQKEESAYDDIPELLRSHPMTEDRIADAEHRLSQFHNKPKPSPLLYHLIKTRLRLIMADNTFHILTYFDKTLQGGHYANKEAVEYGYGIALLSTQQPEKGLAILEKLANQYNDNIIFQMGYAQAAITNDQSKVALTVLEKLYQLHPHQYPVIIAYGQSLLDNNQAQTAVNLLQRYILEHPDAKEQPYGLLSRAQAAIGETAKAYQTRANYYLSHGSHQQALEQLKIALALPELDAPTKNRLNAKITAIEFEMKATKS